MKLILLVVDESGYAKLTPEAVEKMVKEAYDEGYASGAKSVQPYYAPVPWWHEVYPTLNTPIVTCTTTTEYKTEVAAHDESD